MLRRLIIVGLAAGLAAPVFAITPASSAILFTCPTNSVTGSSVLTPGLDHTQTAQSDVDTVAQIGSAGTPCSNGNYSVASGVTTGSPSNTNPTTSFPPRPLGCPTVLGGAGPDYADQTPILISADPGFTIDWNSGANSTGIVKVKSAPTVPAGRVRLLLVVTAGQYAPPAGLKTKLKTILAFTPTGSWTCADNSDPIDTVNIANADGQLIAQQV